MHLSLFVLAFATFPYPVTQAAVEAPPVAVPTPAPRVPGQLEIRLAFRARGPTPSGAALAVTALLAELRDSLQVRHFGDSSLQLGLRGLTPVTGHPADSGGAFDAAITLTLGGAEIARLPELLALLAAAGPVEVSDVRVKLEEGPLPYAALLAQAVAESERQRLTLPSIGGKVGTIALIILAIRREILR